MKITKYIMKNKECGLSIPKGKITKLIDTTRDGDTHYSSEEAIYRNRHN